MPDFPALPAFIQFHGDDELHFIGSQTSLLEDSLWMQAQFHPDDRLIDANGNLFSLQRNEGGRFAFIRNAEQMSLDAVLQLVRRHAAQDGACCVAKLSAGSIAEAIAMLE